MFNTLLVIVVAGLILVLLAHYPILLALLGLNILVMVLLTILKGTTSAD